MNELEPLNNGVTSSSPAKPSSTLTSLEIYDKFGPLAYGIILQIIPQPQVAQEVLVSVFSSPLLQACNSYPFTFAVCVIKLARTKAVEAKHKLTQAVGIISSQDNVPVDKSPEAIFDLSFRQGYTTDQVAEKLSLSKTEVVKAFHDFFKSSRNA